MFRSWPGWLQTTGWVFGWPVLTALWIAARASGTAGRAGATAVLVVGGLLWYGALFGGEPTDTTTTSTSSGASDAGTEAVSDAVEVSAASGSDADAGSSSASTGASTPDSTSPGSASDARRRVPAGIPEGLQPGVVEKIVDGDTIWVRIDEPLSGETMPGGATSKVRLLEVDTPEATTSKECGGKRATRFVLKRIPAGSQVWLQADAEDTDRYGRYLRYVWLDNGKMLNRMLVRRGYGEAVLYEPNDLYWKRMRTAERAARDDGRGLWGQWCAPQPEPDPAPEPPPPAPAPEPEPAREDDAGADCHPSYTGCVPIASDVDCSGGSGDGPRYTTRVEVVGPDVYDLDRDGDGVACGAS